MEKIRTGIGICGLLLLGAVSCEQVSFPQEEPEGEAETVWVWNEDTTGDGTAGAPALVTDLHIRESEFQGRSCWVTGYIVGYVERTLKNAAFTVEGAVQSNVLLADDPATEDVDLCVPVELKTDKWKKAVSLAHCPENLGRRVVVHGLVNTYFGVTGVRDIDGVAWPESDEPLPAPEPELADAVPDESPDEPQEQPSEPDGAFEEKPETDAETPSDGKLLYINKILLQQVKSPAALQVGARYMIGTLPEGTGMLFVATSLQYGTGQSYRRVVEAQGEDGHLVTEQQVAPAVFVLERTEGGYRFRDELNGAYLAYDVRGDASSVSWLSLYTLAEEELDEHYQATFQIEPADEAEQVRTAELVKYSAADSRTCLLRYNSGGKNFKLNYQKNGFAVCLYLLK